MGICFTQYVVIWKLPKWLVGQNITNYWFHLTQEFSNVLIFYQIVGQLTVITGYHNGISQMGYLLQVLKATGIASASHFLLFSKVPWLSGEEPGAKTKQYSWRSVAGASHLGYFFQKSHDSLAKSQGAKIKQYSPRSLDPWRSNVQGTTFTKLTYPTVVLF